MNNNEEFQTIVLAALLHDIGKFIQRAQENPTVQDHSHWGEEWFKSNLAEKLKDESGIILSAISGHHNGHPHIVYLADIIAAGERIGLENEEKGDPFTDRLVSIFSRISISEKPKITKYHKLTSLNKDNLEATFPIDDKNTSFLEYNKLLQQFTNEIRAIDFNTLSSQQVIDLIYFLLWKYTWCIPSAAYRDEPDVSLFEHLKTTAAIAGCLYYYQKENPKEFLTISSRAFCLVGGDVSGIQSYIFELLSQQGKIAKRLRARSLFIQLISEIAAHKLLHTFNLPICNLIMSAGGNFYVLLPNLSTTEEKIKDLQKEFDEWTLNQLNAELSVSLAGIDLSGEDLADFSKAFDKLKTNLNNIKYQPHKHVLTTGVEWVEKEFVRPEVLEKEEEICQGCRKYPQKAMEPNPDNLCERCLNDTKIGQLLPKKKYLVFFNNNNNEFKILNYSFELWDDNDMKNYFTKNPYLILALNDPDTKLPVIGFKHLLKHIPTKEDIPEADAEAGSPVTFEDIANVSEGDKLVAYLKMDIDNLGKIMRYGFDPKEPSNKHKIKGIKSSISRYTALSRMLETFFSGYLQEKLENDFKTIYIVFSGGDDLFVIGPWDKVIDFAKAIKQRFSEYCAFNPDMTLSAGIKLFKPPEPISFCVNSVNEALNSSKAKEGKDGITIFDQTVSWQELDKILTEAKKVIKWLESEPPLISRSFAYNLWIYGEMNRRYEEEKNISYLKFVPLLTYDIGRNLTKEEQKEVLLWAEDLKPSNDKPKGGENLPYLKTIMKYVLTFTRR
ncbi:MAG: type III-A CRISPR-associated protein Cas10/Csm1 [candidate division WOR-3 bacterium]